MQVMVQVRVEGRTRSGLAPVVDTEGVIRASSGRHQGVVNQPSLGHQGVVKGSSRVHSRLIRGSSGRHQGAIRGPSGGHQGCVRTRSQAARSRTCQTKRVHASKRPRACRFLISLTRPTKIEAVRYRCWYRRSTLEHIVLGRIS